MNPVGIISMVAVAVAVAISVVPIIATVFILLSPNRSTLAVPFLAGLVLGLFGVTLLFFWAVSVLPAGRFAEKDPVGGVLLLAIGIGLLLLAAVSTWRARHRPSVELPRWLRSIGSAKPLSSTLIAIGLNLRPKSILLCGSFAVLVHSASLTVAGSLLALAAYTVIGASTVALTVIATLAFPHRAEPVLVATRNWLVKYQAWLSALIMSLVGAILIIESFTRL